MAADRRSIGQVLKLLVQRSPLLRTHPGQIAGVCSKSGIARLDTSNVTAQPVNRVRRDI